MFITNDGALTPYFAEPHARIIAQLGGGHPPPAVLFGATTTGRDLAPRVARRCSTRG